MDLRSKIRGVIVQTHKTPYEQSEEILQLITENYQALQLHKTQVRGSVWIEVLSDHELTEYAEQLKPIWIILEDDETKTPILVQPNGNDDFHGEDDNIYHYCDISHFMKIERPVF